MKPAEATIAEEETDEPRETLVDNESFLLDVFGEGPNLADRSVRTEEDISRPESVGPSLCNTALRENEKRMPRTRCHLRASGAANPILFVTGNVPAPKVGDLLGGEGARGGVHGQRPKAKVGHIEHSVSRPNIFSDAKAPHALVQGLDPLDAAERGEDVRVGGNAPSA